MTIRASAIYNQETELWDPATVYPDGRQRYLEYSQFFHRQSAVDRATEIMNAGFALTAHNLLRPEDFTNEDYVEDRSVARLVVDGGLGICRRCGAGESQLDDFPNCEAFELHSNRASTEIETSNRKVKSL